MHSIHPYPCQTTGCGRLFLFCLICCFETTLNILAIVHLFWWSFNNERCSFCDISRFDTRLLLFTSCHVTRLLWVPLASLATESERTSFSFPLHFIINYIFRETTFAWLQPAANVTNFRIESHDMNKRIARKMHVNLHVYDSL